MNHENYQQWAAQFPEAARAFEAMTGATTDPREASDGSEARVQQAVRFEVARRGAMSWRNNVGATPAKERHDCPRCRYRFETKKTPVRYGLANDSAKLNKRIKSHDLILAIPRRIQQHHVGRTIAQFGSLECKHEGWRYTGTEQEHGQLAWAQVVQSIGGFAGFTTGEVNLNDW